MKLRGVFALFIAILVAPLSSAGLVTQVGARQAPTQSGLSAEGVTGSITDDGVITITALQGESFGLGPTVAIYDDFRNATHDAVVGTAAQIGTWTSATSRGWDDPLLPGGKGIRTVRADSEAGSNANLPMTLNTSQFTEWFVFAYLYVPDGYKFPYDPTMAGDENLQEEQFPQGSNLKFPWVEDIVGGTNGGSATDIADIIALSMIGSGGSWRHLLGNDFTGPGSGVAWNWDEPMLMQAWCKANGTTIVGSDGMVETSNSTGRQYNRYQDTQAWFTSTNQNHYWINVRTPGFIRQGARYPQSNFVTAQVYIALGARANARVLVTDNTTWSSSRIQTICTPTAWSDTEITCTLRKGRHSSFAGKAIHIIKSDETHSNGGTGRLISSNAANDDLFRRVA